MAIAFPLTPGASGTVDSWEADGLPLGIGINRATGELHGVPDVSGQFPVTLRAVNMRGAGSAQTILTVVTPFQMWAAARNLVGPSAAPNADPDYDGIPNIVEYALGLQPGAFNSGALEPHISQNDGTPQLGFSRDSSALGCTLRVETSTDLSVWNSVAKGGGGLDMASRAAGVSVSEQPLSGSLRRVTVSFPPSAGTRLFLRVGTGYSP